jgi:hypothetical protein
MPAMEEAASLRQEEVDVCDLADIDPRNIAR